LSSGGTSRALERRRKKRNIIRCDERDALLEEKHTSESDERYGYFKIAF
jgi:hypothetical protein